MAILEVIFPKTRNLIAFQEYEVGGSSGEAPVIPRSRLAPLMKIRVKSDVYQ